MAIVSVFSFQIICFVLWKIPFLFIFKHLYLQYIYLPYVKRMSRFTTHSTKRYIITNINITCWLVYTCELFKCSLHTSVVFIFKLSQSRICSSYISEIMYQSSIFYPLIDFYVNRYPAPKQIKTCTCKWKVIFFNCK